MGKEGISKLTHDTVSLIAQVYKWVLMNLLLGVTQQWTSIPYRVVVGILIVLA